MPLILLSNHYDEYSFNILKEYVPEDFCVIQLDEVKKEELIEKIPKADYLIASGRLRIDGDALRVANNLKMIARTGVGLDSIDLDAVNRYKIPLYVNHGVNSESVAEFTLLLILACLRKLNIADSTTKMGEWRKREIGTQTHTLAGKKVFIVGYGSIGKKLSVLLDPFGCTVSVSNEISKDNIPKDLLEADIITLHCPLSVETKHVFNANMFSMLKPGCVLINTARGGLINEEDLALFLRNGRIAYAALDVRGSEPAKTLNPFDDLDNVLLTPHIAGITSESFETMMKMALSNIIHFDKGQKAMIADQLWKCCNG